MARWRRQLAKINADTVIVFFGGSYGIFGLTQFAALSGVRVKMSPEERQRTNAILRSYGLRAGP
ncbi:MAG: hypothetical protein NUW23_07630 [Firmicutes bacterium]|nr:hypothetical protein [Bacillota bacterium]